MSHPCVHRLPAWLPMILAACALAGCAGTARAQPAGDFDRPTPPEEPRAELELELDLPASQDCEERFDLAIYQDRRVELVQWDDNVGTCRGRSLRIRYLSAKVDEAALLRMVRSHAKRASTVTGEKSQ